MKIGLAADNFRVLLLKRGSFKLAVYLLEAAEVGRMTSYTSRRTENPLLLGSMVLHGKSIPVIDPLPIFTDEKLEAKGGMFIAIRCTPLIVIYVDEVLELLELKAEDVFDIGLKKDGGDGFSSNFIKSEICIDGEAISFLDVKKLASLTNKETVSLESNEHE